MNGQPFWFVPNYCQITDDGQKPVSFWRLKCTKVILNRVDFFLSRLFVSTLRPALLLLFTTTTVTKLGKNQIQVRDRPTTACAHHNQLNQSMATWERTSKWVRERERERMRVKEWESKRNQKCNTYKFGSVSLPLSNSLSIIFFHSLIVFIFVYLFSSLSVSLFLQQDFYFFISLKFFLLGTFFVIVFLFLSLSIIIFLSHFLCFVPTSPSRS